MSNILDENNRELIIKPPYIYKIFRIDELEILSKGDLDTAIIYYRYSQDYGRTISEWTELTIKNLKSERINPIRFFQIEYLVEYYGFSTLTLNDINIIGNFQNVTVDGLQTNVYGIRENCNCLVTGLIGDASTLDVIPDTSMLMGTQDDNSSLNLPILNAQDIAKLYDPYQQQQALALYNKASNDVLNIFGHDVVYILTDPDKNGTDYTLHEYQLQNYIADAKIKVVVDQNQFPDNNGAINGFDLTLFDTFEIQITKDIFKAAFGVEKRPGIDDVIWFCNLNKLYTVEHSHAVRNFNNYSIYYKMSLKKFNQKANIIGKDEDMQSVIDNLTRNTTIDELMGLENRQDKKSVSNTEQFRSAAQETLRLEVLANIEQERIDNSSVLISKTHYELSTVNYGTEALKYRNFKFFYQPSDNIGYMCWFNINNISMNETYNFFNYFDNNYGFKFSMLGNNIIVNVMDVVYSFSLSTSNSNVLQEGVWYALVINIDQRHSRITAYIYKRNVIYEEDAVNLTSSKLKQLYKIEQPFVPSFIEIYDTYNASILGSDMKITNIRMFVDVIPEKDHNKILNLPTVGSDYKYIIFADHANKEIVLPFYEDSKVNYNKFRRGTNLDE